MNDLVIGTAGAVATGRDVSAAPLRLTFGAHKGRRLCDVPEDYVLWLADPKHDRPSPSRPGRAAGGHRPFPRDIVDAAREMAGPIIARRERKLLAKTLLTGAPHDRPHPLYLIECAGDMHSLSGDFVFDATIHDGLDEALAAISAEYPRTLEPGPTGADLEDVRQTPDQEDDRILIWEILPTGHRKVVWGFFGYHWSADEYSCGQGTLPGDEVDLYSLADRF